MRFTEINLFGVYVAPMSLMMVAWVVTISLRRFAARFSLLRHAGARPRSCWHDRALVGRDLSAGKLAGPEVVV